MATGHQNFDSVKAGIYIEFISIIWMAFEFTIAVYSGILAHSLLLVAFGLDSLIEIVSGTVLLWRLRVEQQGMNVEKIARAERISSYMVGIALLLLAIYIVIISIVNLVTYHETKTSLLGITLAISSCIVMPLLMIGKRKIAAVIGSNALAEDGMCNIVCAYMALTVLVGTALTALFNWWWADSVMALLLVYFVVNEGLEGLHSDED